MDRLKKKGQSTFIQNVLAAARNRVIQAERENLCQNCKIDKQKTMNIITGGLLCQGEWVCSSECYESFVRSDSPEEQSFLYARHD